jgi:hypothetical protein
MSELTIFERDIIECLIGGACRQISDSDKLALTAQLDAATAVGRELTGAGFYLTLHTAAMSPVFPPGEKIGGVSARIEGLEHGAGFVLWFKDGLMSMLEGFSYGEAWPAAIKAYSFD